MYRQETIRTVDPEKVVLYDVCAEHLPRIAHHLLALLVALENSEAADTHKKPITTAYKVEEWLKKLAADLGLELTYDVLDQDHDHHKMARKKIASLMTRR